MRDEDPKANEGNAGAVSRRDFLKISSITVAVPLMRPRLVRAAGAEVEVHGPGKTPISLMVNGRSYSAELEPRVTLLDALRDHFDLTGAKRVCDRAECGACTVLLDNKPVYACSVLAIEAQGHNVTTVEGLTQADRLSPLMQAFVDNDAQQCGFCTPGFIVAGKALLDRTPHPTAPQITKGLSGNFCRCGTYFGMRSAIPQAAGRAPAPAAATKKGA